MKQQMISPLIAAMLTAASSHAQEPARAVFSGSDGKVLFWQTNRLSGNQGICVVKFQFDGTALNQPVENLALAIRIIDKNGADLGTASLVLADPLGGSSSARYREASFEGLAKWPLQDEGALSPLCDVGTTLLVESATGRQSGKVIELVRFGQLRFTSFPRIKVRVGR